MGRAERLRLKRLHRWVVMLRAGAAVFTDEGRESWFGRCQWCQKPRWLSCCHIEPVGAYPHLELDPDNAFAGCGGCHMIRWHRNPRAAWKFRLELLGPELSAELERKARHEEPRANYPEVRSRLESELFARIGRVP